MGKEIQIGELWFSEDTDQKFAMFLNEANKNRKRVFITYNKGWEDFSGYHGGDGLHHRCYIGRSTGWKPIPLVIPSRRCHGGSALLTCKKQFKPTDMYKNKKACL